MPAERDEVVRVVDEDAVVLRSAGMSRLIGVDTPEIFGDQECYGREASRFAKRGLRPGLWVGVGRDVEERDRYGRTLVNLRLPDGKSFNELLVAQGFAVVGVAGAAGQHHADTLVTDAGVLGRRLELRRDRANPHRDLDVPAGVQGVRRDQVGRGRQAPDGGCRYRPLS